MSRNWLPKRDEPEDNVMPEGETPLDWRDAEEPGEGEGHARAASSALREVDTPAKSWAELSEEGVMDALKDVYDPELAIDIVSLGLIYGVQIEGKAVRVRMTLTSPGCPVGPMLQAMAHSAVKRVYPDVEDVHVDLVWTPPWDPYKMASEEAKDMLGIW